MAAFASVIRTRWAHLTRAELYALLVQFSNASAALSVQNYTSERLAAGIRSRFTVSAAPPASPEQFANTLNWVYGGGTASIAVHGDTACLGVLGGLAGDLLGLGRIVGVLLDVGRHLFHRGRGLLGRRRLLGRALRELFGAG